MGQVLPFGRQCCGGSKEYECPRYPSINSNFPDAVPSRHLVLHFDVNKTIVMVDTIKGQPVPTVLNGILSETTWGREVAGCENGPIQAGWSLVHSEPSVLRTPPANGSDKPLISYLEYLEQRLPGPKQKKEREQLYTVFTEPGQPGEKMRPHFDLMRRKLHEGNGQMANTQKMVISAFYELIAQLVLRGRSFSILFRTFGNDLPEVAKEFNEFCAGQHPKYSRLRLDGTGDSGLDLRVVPQNTGSWYREAGRVAIAWGTLTLEEDLKAIGGNFGAYRLQPEQQHLRICEGVEQVYEDLKERTQQICTIALRDYWPFWHKSGQRGICGKPLLVNIRDESRLDLFFDDNIGLNADDTRIVDVRDGTDGSAIWPVYAQRYYICRAEPLYAILDDDFFLRKIEEKEASHERRKTARRKLKKVVRGVTAMHAFRSSTSGKRSKQITMPELPEYEPWKRDIDLLNSKRTSIVSAFGDEHEMHPSSKELR